jgi:NosR/NirI family transcriptional regulator, nitrous oxide reductase regulator
VTLETTGLFRFFLVVIGLLVSTAAFGAHYETGRLPEFLGSIAPANINPEADAYGEARADHPVVPLLKGSQTIGWAFLTSDFVSTTGYSGKPIHIIVAVDLDAIVTGVRLVEHAEPIVLIGIPESKITALTERYAGLDLRIEAEAGGTGHDLDIISGATVTIVVIDDSIVRAGIKVARALGLGGLGSSAHAAGPIYEVDPTITEPRSWRELSQEGAISRLTLDIGQINQAFVDSGDAKAAARPETGDGADTFIDLYAAPASVPAIGKSILGESEYQNLLADLKEGEHAIVLAGRGRYSFKGSGYVRGGVFDRIHLIQGDLSVRFRDRQHRRLGSVAAADAPSFSELDLFTIPADSGFDPVLPWRVQLLVHRSIGAIEKSYLTFDLGYQLPRSYTRQIAAPAKSEGPIVDDDATEAAAKAALWQRIWFDRQIEIVVLVTALLVLTGLFFFQVPLTRNETFVFWFRIGFLSFTLVWLGWYANAQLSVVNVLAVINAVTTNFSWDAFLIDPLVFILWASVAASLLFWGRGAFCGWLCPFGALQELLNRLAKFLRIPQWRLPWALHDRLRSLKYIIFLALFGLSIYSLPLAEQFAEIEPFKTAIILKFQRSWPFIAFVVVLLVAGLFVERFYCRYLCPLGAALAIPSKIRVFDWMYRYRECGSPCQRCANECMVQAIHPRGQIDANECLSCMHCQVLYQHDQKCPVCIKQRQRREPYLKESGKKAKGKDNAKPATA